MEINYIENGSPDCPLIQISKTTADDIKELLAIWHALSETEKREIDLGMLNEMINCDHIHLICKIGTRDIGIKKINQKNFDCILTEATWLQVHGLTEPFLKEINGYQWLTTEGEIRLLLSPLGGW
jgi:hypothetical protein